MKPLDTSRYRLDPPPQNKQNDPNAWRGALDNAHAQLEHQYLRIMNLEMLLKYGDKVRGALRVAGLRGALRGAAAAACTPARDRGPNSAMHPRMQTWRAQNQMSEAAHKALEAEVAATRRRVNELNQERKLSQTAAGEARARACSPACPPAHARRAAAAAPCTPLRGSSLEAPGHLVGSCPPLFARHVAPPPAGCACRRRTAQAVPRVLQRGGQERGD